MSESGPSDIQKPDDISVSQSQQNVYLRLCSDMYFNSLSMSLPERFKRLKEMASAKDLSDIVLFSPERKSEVVDSWSPLNVAKYMAVAAVCGREHDALKVYTGKTSMDLTDMYYGVWKDSRQYKMCKKARSERTMSGIQ